MNIRSLKILLVAVLLGSACCMSACKTAKTKANSPEAVAKKFLKHLSLYEFAECRELGNSNTDKMIDMLEVLMDLSKEKGQEGQLEKKEREITVVKTAIDGKVAVVTYLDEKGIEQTLNMVKEDGKWLVDMKKEMPGGN